MKKNENKVLFLLHIPPPVHGSSIVGKYIFDSEKINTTFDCSFINLLLSKSVGDSGKFGLQKIYSSFTIILRLLKYLFTNKPALVYFALTSRGLAFYRDVLIVSIIKSFRIPLVYHLHNRGYSDTGRNRIKDFLNTFVFKNTKVILLSQHLYYDIERYVDKNDVLICPNGSPRFDGARLQEDREEIVSVVRLLFLSNLIESKGVFVLLEACKILKSRNLEFKCTFIGGVGDIQSDAFSNRVHEYGLEDEVKYLGPKYGDEKIQYLVESDVFVFPTYFDTFGLVILEAMQLGLPVVSTFEGGIPDIVKDGVSGFLVPRKNAVALADKLEILLNDSELRTTMGRKGKELYESKFTIDEFEKNLLTILSKQIE